MNNTSKKEILVKKYIYSIMIDLMIFFVLLIGYLLSYNTISNWFGDYGKFVFWIYILAVIVIHLFSDTMIKFQSIGKMIFKIKIYDKNGKKASLLNLALQRIIEIPILVIKNKDEYFDKVLRISNTNITMVDTK